MTPAWKFTFRSLRQSPGFALAAVGTLALGIGANTTMFSVIHAILLRPVPGFETHRVVQVVDASHQGLGFVNQDAFLEMRKRARSYEQLAAHQFCQMNLTGWGEPRQVIGPCMTANWFAMQNETPLLGRTFAPDEDRPGRSHVVVLDHGFWTRHFGGDPKVIGRTLTLDRQAWEIIGVTRPGFQVYGVTTPDIYTPYVMEEHPGTGVSVVGRLRRNVTVREAAAEAGQLSAALGAANPDWKGMQLKPVPVLERITGGDRGMLLTLLAAVSFVLLIACANVASLMLARSAGRTQEMAIRTTLGATRGEIVRMALRETLVLSLAAAVASVAMAEAALRGLRPLLENLPRANELSIDGVVFGVALALGVLTAVLAGILPAWRMADTEGAASMRSRSTVGWQHALLTSEIALAFVLLTGAGLMLRSFAAARAVDLGYRPASTLTHFLSLPVAEDGKRTEGNALYARMRDAVAQLPSVVSAATTSSLPSGGVLITMDVQPEGQPARRQERGAAMAIVSPNYFSTMAIPIRDGRGFAMTDRAGGVAVAMVSQSVAKRHFGGSAVGKRILLPEVGFNLTGERMVPYLIVGVTGNVCVNSVRDCEAEHIYLAEAQSSIRMTYLVVRTQGDPLALAQVIRRRAQSETPLTPLADGKTLEELTAYLTDGPKRAMWLLGLFAALAVSLAAVGIYGVTNYLAAQRTREAGIRMALGARMSDLLVWMMRRPALSCWMGLVVGAGLVVLLVRFLDVLLYGVPRFDAWTMASSAGVLFGAGLLATLWPALRAARVNPVEALRQSDGKR